MGFSKLWPLAPLFACMLAATAQTQRRDENRHDRPAGASPCPTVTASCQDSRGKGEPLTVTANVSGGDPNVTPTFDWKVSAGTIKSGQGTRSIAVETGAVRSGVFTATLEVRGFDRSCATSTSCSVVSAPPRMPWKVDEYGDIEFGDEKARLDNLAEELRNEPTARGYFVCYGGRRSGPGAARRRCDRAAKYVADSRGIDRIRLAAVDGGYRDGPTVEFWIVPSGAAPPKPTPTVFPRGRPRR